MKFLPAFLAFLVLASSQTTTAHSAPAPEDPAKQTPWGLYLNATEAYALKQQKGDQVLFVDGRDPVEIMFTGFTNSVDVNVPFWLADPSQWNAKKSVLKMVPNRDFEPGIAKALEQRQLDKTTPIILMCRSGGTRGAPSARALHGKGYATVYVVVDGFEGSTLKDGPKKGWRLKNGWKNAGLPWSYKLNKSKIFGFQD